MDTIKPTHTPGPWKVGEASRRKNGQTITRVAIQADDGHYITDNVMASSFSAGEHESNARLIAAAPDLLAALKTQWDALSDILENPGIITDAERAAGIAAIETTRAAILRAEDK